VKRLLPVAIFAFVCDLVAASAQINYKTLYITPNDDGFEVYLAAAMTKKKVPVTVVTDPASGRLHDESLGRTNPGSEHRIESG